VQAPANVAATRVGATLPFLPWGSITLIVKLRVTVNCGVNYRPLLCCRNTRADCGGPRGCRCVAPLGRVRAARQTSSTSDQCIPPFVKLAKISSATIDLLPSPLPPRNHPLPPPFHHYLSHTPAKFVDVVDVCWNRKKI